MRRQDIISGNIHLSVIKRLFIGGAIALVLSACTEQSVSTNTDDGVVDGQKANQSEQSNNRPNLLIVMADDLGYSDLGAFGGEIATPSLDELAQSGTQMVDFYASLTCSPSRAMLMSGADNHLAGLGNMDETLADNQLGIPGYEGYLNERVLTLAEALKSGGYQTYMAGKWHLGMTKELGPAQRGFDESFALLLGGASHYDNSFGPDMHRTEALYRDNGELLNRAPEGFFSSDYYTNRIIENIENGKAQEQPFFAYLSFTAPHWPLQFPPSYDGKYAQTYNVGWAAIRDRRLARLKELGVISKASQMAPFKADWDALSDEEKKMSAKKMEIYAAMVDDMDANIGKLIDYLKGKGLYDNTLIVFLSDNGASSWANDTSPPAIRDWASNFNNVYENAGQPDSFILYGKQWAEVSNTPYKHSKGSASEGGIRVPMILRMPSHLQNQSSSSRSEVLAGIEDIMPTFLELAGVDVQSLNAKQDQVPVTGESFLTELAGDENSIDQPGDSNSKKVLAREIWGKQGLRAGSWKLVNQPPPNGNGAWQLYNLASDIAEQIDLASTEPQKLAEMLELWQDYVDSNNVVLPEGEFRVRDVGALPTE
ncbi:MAG: arylsulfatase [Arenicella sp.]|nr:arylsulfatase [Arenicella sp.]